MKDKGEKWSQEVDDKLLLYQRRLTKNNLEKNVRFYYLKFGDVILGHPTDGVATVCIISGIGHGFVRGIAFCNPKDQFARKVGRAIALERAFLAIDTKMNHKLIHSHSVCGVLLRYSFTYFSEYYPALTEYESRLFEYKKKEKTDEGSNNS